MHELLLFSQVSAARHDLVLGVLAGLTSMQPQELVERRLLFRPAREPGAPVPRAVVKRGADLGLPPAFVNDQFYVQTVGDLSRKFRRDGQDPGEARSDFDQYAWTVEFRDFPEVPVGKRQATSRIMASKPIDGLSPLKFMEGLGYRYTGELMLRGKRFTYGNIDLHLQRTYLLLDADGKPSLPAQKAADVAHPAAEAADVAHSKLLDESGAHILQASIIVQDDSKPEIMDSAFGELQALKDLLRGCVDLSIGDRLTMNTRVR